MAVSPTPHGVIAVLIGLPGAGKTTFAKKIYENFTETYSVLHICYDSILNDRACWDDPCYSWKIERGLLVASVEHIFVNLRCLLDEKNHVTFNIMETPPISEISNDFWQNFIESFVKLNSRKFESRDRFLILIDDNMYYRSMRYPYFQIARRLQFGFIQIFVDSELGTVLERNQSRENDFVSPTIIKKMADKIEKPDSDKFGWEKYSIIWKSNGNDFGSNLIALHAIVNEAIDNPPKPLNSEEMNVERTLNRSINRENTVHQIDLIMRKSISEFMKSCPINEEKIETGRKLSKKKEWILAKFKSGEFVIENLEQERGRIKELLFVD